MAALVVSVDVGKTGCRAALFEGERRLEQVEHEGARGAADSQGLSAALHAVDAVAARLDPVGQCVDAVGAGVAGLGQAADDAATVAEHLSACFGTRKVAVASDMTTSHAGALLGAPGVVVAAGTGTVALAVDEAGHAERAGGWGYLIGDDGSGYAIGRAGLRGALKYHERRGGSALLHHLAERRYGPPGQIPGLVHGAQNPAREVAAFASEVAVAAREGDRMAAEIWRNAAVALADTTVAATRLTAADTTPVAISLTGGLSTVADLFADPWASEVLERLPTARVRPAAGDALEGGYVLAISRDGFYETLTYRLDGPRKRELSGHDNGAAAGGP